MRRRNWNFPAKIRFELRRLKIIRSFTEPVSIEQNPSGDVELSLVVFTVHDSYSDCKLRSSGWTRDVDVFFQWLSALQFSGGGFSDVAAADGLAAALMMFSSLNGSQENGDGKRHCILVAASNPYPLPTAVSYPAMLNLEQSGNIEVRTIVRLADAEIVAKAFPQCSVSLSVICSRKLPKLRAIYDAAKRDPQAADPPVDTSKNPNFLVLISEHFSEGCAAFSHTEMESLAPDQSLVEMDMTFEPPIARTAATSNSSAMNQQPISAGNIPAATVNFVTSVSGPVMSRGNLPGSQMMQSGIGMHQNVLSGTATGMPSGHLLSNILEGSGAGSLTAPVMSQMMQSGIGMHQNVPHTGMPWGQLLSNIGVGAGSLTAPVMSQMMQSGIGMHQNVPSGTDTGMPSGQLLSNIREGSGAGSLTAPVMSQMMQSGIGMHQNVPHTGMPWGQLLSNIGVGAGSLTAPVMSQMMQSGIGVHQNVPSGMGTGMPSGQLLSTIQEGIGAGSLTAPVMSLMMQSGIGMHQNVTHTGMPWGQLLSNIGVGAGSLTAPVMSQRNLPESQMMQRGIGMHQNVPSGMGTGMPSEIGTMMPTPGMTQQGQPGILPLGRNNSAEANMSLSQHQTMATSPSPQSGFVKIWEGSLSMVRENDEPIHISRLEGFKRSSPSESLAANFPQTLQILDFVPKKHMIEHHASVTPHTGKAEILAFWAIEEHAILNSMQAENLGGVISLPSQTLFVYVSDRTFRLIGWLLPYEYPQLQAQPLYQLHPLQVQPLDRVEHLQAQPLDRVEHLQAQPLDRVEHLQAQPLDQVEHLQAQPLDRVEHLQAQPLDRVEHLQAQPLDQVEHLQAQPLDRVEHLQVQPLDRVEHLQAQPLDRVEHLPALPLIEAEYQEILDFIYRSD